MKMSQSMKKEQSFSLNSKDLEVKLENLISAAIQKIGGQKENDLCKFLPQETGGYIHHFTMRKMKFEEPEKLVELINTFITSVERPEQVTPKKRAPRGSRKKDGKLVLSKEDLDRMLRIARLAGDKEMVEKLTPKKSFVQIKRDLMNSIRHGRVDQELWTNYVEAVARQMHSAF